ncbi:hypothetical protein F5880DRAFT_1308855 [Lentinula raphanica]|nr:hypothetical protein F5880DRAFT_1308855 [Lentinula raphanica]
MKIQLFQFRTVLLLAMSSALVLKTCYAYPLHAPGEPQDSQNSHTNAPVATIQPDRLPQLVSRGPPSFFKKIDKALGSDRKVLGFAYVKPGQELPPGGQSVNLDQLEIPVMRLHSNRDMLYLLTSRPKMKPQDPNVSYSVFVRALESNSKSHWHIVLLVEPFLHREPSNRNSQLFTKLEFNPYTVRLICSEE